MSSQQHEPTRVGAGALLASGALLALSGCSVSDGAQILIPKPAEFFPSLVAFIIIWVILAKLAWPSILKSLDARQEKIQGDISAAEKSRQKAAEDQEAYAEQLANAQTKADQIVADAKRQAEEERSRILTKAQEEASATISKAHDAVDSERRKAMIELSGSVVDLAVDIASKIIGNELSVDEQRRLAEKYLEEVGKDNDKQA